MQQSIVSKDVLPKQQEWNQCLVQKDSEPPNIKEEQEELWSDSEEKPQLPLLHQSKRDESTEVELLASFSTEHRTLKIGANGEDCGASQPASNSDVQPHTDGWSSGKTMAESATPEEKCSRKKAPTFSKAEEALLLGEYERRRGVLERSKGTKSVLAAKRRAWKEIAVSLNSFNVNAVRSWEDVRRKYKNILQSGKKKRDISAGTGGSPTQVLTETEEKTISLNEAQDTIIVLASGKEGALSAVDVMNPVSIMDLGFQILENGWSSATTMAESATPEKCSRKKAPTFSKAEEALLLEEYDRRRGALECSKGTTSALAAKRRAWEEIAASLNSFNIRSWEDVRRKYKNILQSGKKKTDSNGGMGGDPTQVLTETEKTISLNEDQDTIIVLESGKDGALCWSSATTMAESAAPEEKHSRKKAPTFSKAEEALLLGEYERRRGVLECSTGTSSALAAKRQAWEEIAVSLNSFNVNAVRSWEDVRRKYKNILQSGKKKTDSNAGTGGVPTQVLTEAEEKGISLNEAQNTITVLESGRDNALPVDIINPVSIMNLGFQILENDTVTKPPAETPATSSHTKKVDDAWQEYLQCSIDAKKALLPLQMQFYKSAARYFDSQTELANIKIKVNKKKLDEE
ncbi:uncharacterized protein LOC117531192 isoform X2 [Thalassophryne amazonica]|uniref:uncharacterized protein LOC117531192 isoform X2 n=1 Tax=Thalassophryne amazonica TaxID=390379 RepID=UPI00147203B2|nr:uncharacterized protein LOC117531192 isoform X2 [Thalassophryne amazonica]